MLEAGLKDQCMKLLRSIPDSYWWRQGSTQYGMRGVSDILGCMQGFMVAIEVKKPGRYKTPGDGLTEHQFRFLENIKGCGGYAAAIDSLDQLMDFLAETQKSIEKR
jgi:hypothetical protein